MNSGFLPNGQLDTAGVATGISIPPSSVRTIGDPLNDQGISWAYYAGRLQRRRPSDECIGRSDLLTYCKICNFEAYASSIMANPTQCLSLIR
jgi:phospholipase C